MFKTISVQNISESYNKKVMEHNSNNEINKYLATYGMYHGAIGSYEEEYKFWFLLLIENSFGEEEKIKFGYKHDNKEKYSKYDYRPDAIIGGNILDNAPEQAIYKFCSKYGKYLLDGYDIEEIAENDEGNILNYVVEKTLSKKSNSNIKR